MSYPRMNIERGFRHGVRVVTQTVNGQVIARYQTYGREYTFDDSDTA